MISFIAIVITYFAFSLGLPWHLLPTDFSFSYLFDLFFALIVSFIYRLPWKFRWNFNKQNLIAIGEVVGFALVCVATIHFMEIETPFRLVNGLPWHLLLFAPVLEELIFRQTFQRLLIHQMGGKRVTSMLVASIFAFSHLVGLEVLPHEYIPFIGFQVFYTFILGIFCGQALLRFHSVLAPITLHFLFNLVFFLGIHWDFI